LTLRIGIDASNLRKGGGPTHLAELLGAARPEDAGIRQVIVWGASGLLQRLPSPPWLERVTPRALDSGPVRRLAWQSRSLGAEARKCGCDLLFAPGGTYLGDFRPFVTMSRNLLPFDPAARRAYGRSLTGIRLRILTEAQSRSFRRAAGVIFLTDTARRMVEARTGRLPGHTTVIPHGVSSRFARPPRPQLPLKCFNAAEPFRWLYVSIVDRYKHHAVVVDAVARLRSEGFPVALDLIGPAYPPALRELRAAIQRFDPDRQVVRYLGEVPYSDLERHYHEAHAAVFASSCENMPNILLEKMAAGLPVACSNRGVMPEVLGDAGVYFDPIDAASVTKAMRALLVDTQRRQLIAGRAFARAATFTWEQCARDTFGFLADVARGH
jgi:glycosyltransferase involved in cell wall biosynthesis